MRRTTAVDPPGVDSRRCRKRCRSKTADSAAPPPETPIRRTVGPSNLVKAGIRQADRHPDMWPVVLNQQVKRRGGACQHLDSDALVG